MDLVTKEQAAIVPLGTDSLFFNEAKFALAEKVAKIFSDSTMVPEHFQKNTGNCLIALNYANRINADPFMLMQNMYIVYGRPGLEGKLVIALVNQCGRFEPLEFVEDEGLCDGKKENGRGCIAKAKEKKSGKILEGVKIDWAMVKAEGWLGKKGSKWMTMPQQMFRYRSAAFFARAYCPEVLLGMQTREELQDITDLRRNPDGTYTTDEDLKGKTEEKIDALKEKAKEGLNKDISDVYHDEFKEKLKKKLEEKNERAGEPVDTGKPEDFETDVNTEVATKWWDRSEWKNLRTGNGKTTGFAGWINGHLIAISAHPSHKMLPNNIKAEMLTKWNSMYKEPFPTLKPSETEKDQGGDQKGATSSSELDQGDTWGAGDELEAARKEETEWKATINRTGFPEIDDALDALGAHGPEVYERAKNNLGPTYQHGAHTTDMAVAIAKEMTAIVDKELPER